MAMMRKLGVLLGVMLVAQPAEKEPTALDAESNAFLSAKNLEHAMDDQSVIINSTKKPIEPTHADANQHAVASAYPTQTLWNYKNWGYSEWLGAASASILTCIFLQKGYTLYITVPVNQAKKQNQAQNSPPPPSIRMPQSEVEGTPSLERSYSPTASLSATVDAQMLEAAVENLKTDIPLLMNNTNAASTFSTVHDQATMASQEEVAIRPDLESDDAIPSFSLAIFNNPSHKITIVRSDITLPAKTRKRLNLVLECIQYRMRETKKQYSLLLEYETGGEMDTFDKIGGIKAAEKAIKVEIQNLEQVHQKIDEINKGLILSEQEWYDFIKYYCEDGIKNAMNTQKCNKVMPFEVLLSYFVPTLHKETSKRTISNIISWLDSEFELAQQKIGITWLCSYRHEMKSIQQTCLVAAMDKLLDEEVPACIVAIIMHTTDAILLTPPCKVKIQEESIIII